MFPKNKPISQQTRCQTVSEPRFVMTQMQDSIDCMRLGHVFFSNGNEMWKSQRHKTNHLVAILNHPKRKYTQLHKPLLGMAFFLIVTHVYPISLPICAVVVVVVVCW